MLHENHSLVNQARRLIAVAHLFEGGVKSAKELEEECSTFVILARDQDPGYLEHLEAWILDHENDSQLDMFDP